MTAWFSPHLTLIALSLFVCINAQSVSPLPQGHRSTFHCGTDWLDSSKCTHKCPGGEDGECPNGEKCFADSECFDAPLPSASPFTSATHPGSEKQTELGHSSTFSCGTDWQDSSKCTHKCPSGKDTECPSGETCFADAECFDVPLPSGQPLPSSGFSPSEQETGRGHNSTFFCGTDWLDSSKCTHKCPSGMDSECPSGEACFADAECDSSRPSPSPSTSPAPPPSGRRTKSVGNEKRSSTASLWKWLGPSIGAVSIVTFAVVALFCVRKQRERARNDVVGETV